MRTDTALLDIKNDRIWFRTAKHQRVVTAWVSCPLLRKIVGFSAVELHDALALYRANEAMLHTIATSASKGVEPIALDDVPWMNAWIKLSSPRHRRPNGEDSGATR